jgi:hypothetical protein
VSLLPMMSMFTSVIMRTMMSLMTVMHDMTDVLDNCQVNIIEILSVCHVHNYCLSRLS